MQNGIIGYTGFVGSTLCGQTEFSHVYNSSNIQTIQKQEFDLLICAGAPAAKWKANQSPEADLANIQYLIDSLRQVTAKQFVLISTVDVYPHPIKVNELTTINSDIAAPYGKHRFLLEQFVSATFPTYHIIRLPGLFGKGLKKNFLYDLLHQQCFELTHQDSEFQFYNLKRLWKDIQTVIHLSLPVVNLVPEPVRAGDIAQKCFQVDFTTQTEKPPVFYDVRSIYAKHFGGGNSYLYSATDTYQQITEFSSESNL